MLQLLQDIARHLEVETTSTPEQLRDLMKKTDLRRLTNRIELAEPVAAPSGATASTPHSSTVARSSLAQKPCKLTGQHWRTDG